MQLLAKDLLTLDDKANDWPANWEAERPLLAADGLRAGGRLRLRVRGESMLPSLWPGDEVEIASCPVEDIRKGEVVLAMRDGRFFLHRFVGRLPGGFLLRGDSMPAADSEFPVEALLGRLSQPIPLHWWSLAMGRILSRCGPALRLALKLHARSRGREMPQAASAAGAGLSPARERVRPRHTISTAQPAPELPHARA
jgi:hypothetical protein